MCGYTSVTKDGRTDCVYRTYVVVVDIAQTIPSKIFKVHVKRILRLLKRYIVPAVYDDEGQSPCFNVRLPNWLVVREFSFASVG